MKTIMITGPSSNSGKTILTLGIIRAIKNRNINVLGFKTGPDFIDRKYLEIASGNKAGNLDMHLMGRRGIHDSLAMNNGEFAVIEGAMGYFDGIYNTYENSSFDISKELNVPAILVYTPRGEMFSAIPKIKGMVDFKGSEIKAIILNKVTETMYKLLKEQIEEYIGIKVLGYLPFSDELQIESRSLGLIGVDEQENYEKLIEQTSHLIEETINIDEVLSLGNIIDIEPYRYKEKRNIKVAIAYDKAFNFYFNENLNLLENMCNTQYFSPLKDEKVPECDLIYIGGGYPENYLLELSTNKNMKDSIYKAAKEGVHIIGEAGGFMYLTSSIEDYPMVDIFKGNTSMTDKLQRFGYTNIELKEDTILGNKGWIIPSNEYHRSLVEIKDQPVFHIKKPKSKRSWECGYKYKNTLGYYQHINFLGNMESFNHLLDSVEKNKEKRVTMYVKKPMEIENKSMNIIDEVMGDTNFSEEEMIIAKRMIHTTGDFEYRKIIDFSEDFINTAKQAIKEGVTIYTDTKMVHAGINKKALDKANCKLKYFIDDERAYSLSKELSTTRSSCAIDLAISEGLNIFVIGNAPTALFRILELVDEGKLDPRFIIGVPVGFVGAAESKELLREYKNIPSISTIGYKGGSNVAASIINALLYMVVGRD